VVEIALNGDNDSLGCFQLRKQLAELNKNPVEGFSAGLIDESDIFRWEVNNRLHPRPQG
jgi:ubiquitin-conjugating enzyme E2 G1